MASGHSPSSGKTDGEVGGKVDYSNPRLVLHTPGIEDANDCVGGRTMDSRDSRDSDKIPTPVIYKVDVKVCTVR